MMYLQLIVSLVFINFVSAADLRHIPNQNGKGDKALTGPNGRINTVYYGLAGEDSGQSWLEEYGGGLDKKNTLLCRKSELLEECLRVALYNITYIDRAENLIRLPAMNKSEDKKFKRKTYKKTPKRTIQKIIKKNNKSKIRKMYLVRMTSSSTMMPKFDIDNDQDDYSLRKSEVTIRPNQQKKIKKYNVKQVKLPRYPLPYRKMQTKKNNYKRPKRETRDVFILKDFDSLKFLKEKREDDDYNIVDAHIKNYW